MENKFQFDMAKCKKGFRSKSCIAINSKTNEAIKVYKSHENYGYKIGTYKKNDHNYTFYYSYNDSNNQIKEAQYTFDITCSINDNGCSIDLKNTESLLKSTHYFYECDN